MSKVTPVILAGGVGSRLWPLSNEARPKQFLSLVSDQSMLQDTFERLRDDGLFAAPAVVCNERYAELVSEQAREAGIKLSALILEPMSKNSAPAIAAATAHFAKADPETKILISTADHLITDPTGFRAAVAEACALADTGRLATFGIAPDRPETGYGYIKGGDAIEGTSIQGEPGRVVASFEEKPDLATAERFLASGEYSWNSGMFLFRATDMLRELQIHQPAMLEAVDTALSRATVQNEVIHLDAAAFEQAPSISIDYAVMEPTDQAAVAKVSFGWSDIGAWDALSEKLPADGDGNVMVGAVASFGARNVYCRSEGPFVAAIGVEDLVIVATGDTVLVCRKDDAQRVKEAFNHYKERG